MPYEVIEDLVSPEVGAPEDMNGVTAIRKFFIDGLTPGPGMWFEARNLLASQYGVSYLAPHPYEPKIVCQKVDAKGKRGSRTQSIVTATYQPPQINGSSEMVVRFCGSTREIATNFDHNGNKIDVFYTSQGGDKHKTTGEVLAPHAYGILEFSTTAYAPPSIAFLNALDCLNTTAWQGGKPYTWWFRDMDVEENVYQGTYRTSFRFEYDRNTHLKVVAYRIHGSVPQDVDNVDFSKDKGNGWARAKVYGLSDFNTLALKRVLT